MNTHRAYFPRDDAPVPDGDRGWLGVNLRLDPARLEDGLAASAINLRFSNGVAAPRKGIRLLSWGARTEAGYGPSDILAYGTVAGAGVFNDPRSGSTWLIIATTTRGVYRTQPGTTGIQMALPTGEVIPSRVQLIQTYNGLVMLRGPDHDPLYCDNLDLGWRTIPVVTEPGKVALPRSSNGVYFQNRLFVVYEGDDSACRDCIFVSDFGGTTDALQGSLAYNGFKINQGSRDSLVALYKFNDTTLIAFKEQSVYFVSNIAGTNAEIAANATLDAVTTEYGLRSPRAVVQVGNDVWFLGHKRGVCSIRQTETNKLQGVDVPVSQDIQPLIDRINWTYADNATMAQYDNKVYVAVPMDNATDNEQVLVYDGLTQRWAGYDTSDALRVKEWLEFTYAGVIRLVFVSSDGFVALYEDGYLDHVGNADGTVTYVSVETTLRTRGYAGRDMGQKRFGNARVGLATWWPEYSIGVLVDGVAERTAIRSDVTRDRVAYDRPHDAVDWDPSNANDDFLTPYRQDYSLRLETGESLETGTNGLQASLHQSCEEGMRLRCRGRYVQLEITGTQGRTEVHEAMVEAFRGSPRLSRQL